MLNKKIMETSSPIEQLPSSLLEKIFAYLPLKDRYLTCLVSGKWHAVSRVPWTDVTFLNLNSIPRAMADPILGLCPKLVLIEASDHTIILVNNAVSLISESVRTLKFRNVRFAGKDLSSLIPAVAAAEYHRMISSASALITKYFERFPKLSKLTLRDCQAAYSPPQGPPEPAEDDGFRPDLAVVLGLPIDVAREMAESIKHVVLTRAAANGDGLHIDFSLRLRNAECVYLDGNIIPGVCGHFVPRMRELCVVGDFRLLAELAEEIGAGRFPALQVFVYASDEYVDPDSLTHLITAKTALRILVVAGKDTKLSVGHIMYDFNQQDGLGHPNAVQYPIVLPPRKFPFDSAASNQPRLPPLQIFVGGDFTKHVRFTLPKSEVAQFWRIDCPMPEYLAKPDVADVFKDVWVAKIIREGPENGLKPWGSPDDMELFYSTSPLLFC